MRGEEWAAPARDIALKRYDQPSITILTVLLILGLHEFGTCQGGRSWMFGGMAMRMAYALQLHRESDYDPLSRNSGSDPKLSATDQEIRRRTMWACFLMDRFNSSGTERPTCGTEEHIKVQLPIKEFNFQNEIPGPTENLDGNVPCPVSPDTGQDTKVIENMGVSSYMIRIIALWGRVIRYLNLGGKERDPYPLWHPSSQYGELKKQADDFKNSLPSTVQDSPDNLANHAAEKLANQFLFMHISYHQVVLFLHRYAIPTTPGTRIPKDVPKDFLSDAAQVALEAADQISVLISAAREYNLIAPFAGYCAFTSSTVHIWGMFSKNPGREASSKQKLQLNLEYIKKMKKYWGMFHFMAENLEDIYKRYADASQKGTKAKESSGSESNLFQYGDWFKKYPNGVSESDYEDPATKVKEERINEAAVSHKSDLQSVEEFFNKLSPPVRTVPQPPKPRRKASKPTASTVQPHPPQVLPPDQSQESTVQHMLPMAPQTPIAPSPFSPHQSQPLYASFPPQPYDLLAQHPNTALLPQLDRNLVYDAYAGTSGPPLSSSDPAFNSLAVGDPIGSVWDNPLGYGNQAQALGDAGSYAGEMQSSAWFMPFNMPPPSFPGDGGGDYGGFGVDASNVDGMGGGGDDSVRGGRSQ